MNMVMVGCDQSCSLGVTGWTTGLLIQDVSNLKEASCHPDMEQTGSSG